MKDLQPYIGVSEKLKKSPKFTSITTKIFNEIHDSDISPNDVYILDRPMMDSNTYSYEYDEAFFVLIKNHKIIFFDSGANDEDFNYYVEDALEDLKALSRRFSYVKLIGRGRSWMDQLIKVLPYEKVNEVNILEESSLGQTLSRKANLLISLFTGSINNPDKIDEQVLEKEQITILEAVNNRIMLFDTNQTKFVYDETTDQKITRIQGLAGAGKTELLLHKLRKLYVEDKNCKIAMTCFNKVLAENLSARIPKFFNYMKVDEQIDYSRLFVSSSWGGANDPSSGLYSKICNHYNLKFQRYSRFKPNKEVWKDAIDELKQLDQIEPLFDYILIDESQDFDEEYFELCNMITSKKLYIAGDVLQNIFSINKQLSTTKTDYILNKVYRTDPRTILFSHILGFGLYESKAVRWLSDVEWKMSGYTLSKVNEATSYRLEREFIDRFEENKLGIDFPSIIVEKIENENYNESILAIIDQLISDHAQIKPKDVAIVLTQYNSATREMAKNLGQVIYKKYNWEHVLVPDEKRINDEDEIAITNINNVKGLEFSFVIVVNNQGILEIEDEHLNNEIRKRNALYMSLTRSFITSYLIMSTENTSEAYIDKLVSLAEELNEGEASTIVEKPNNIVSESELYNINVSVRTKSQDEIIRECIDVIKLSPAEKAQLREFISISPAIKAGTTDKDEINRLIKTFLPVL
ncbi:AAA family ATPase [Lactococcus lactis subsp. lactis]|uniref:DEAD/DEAH box helicase n=1 Tax=Lactococcus lactis TaxID=1358 RepID=UPI00338EB877